MEKRTINLCEFHKHVMMVKVAAVLIMMVTFAISCGKWNWILSNWILLNCILAYQREITLIGTEKTHLSIKLLNCPQVHFPSFR